MNETPMVTLETMAAQAMGEVDPVSGDVVPPIHMSTTYERQTDGSYLQDRVYTRANNRPSSTRSAFWPRSKADPA